MVTHSCWCRDHAATRTEYGSRSPQRSLKGASHIPHTHQVVAFLARCAHGVAVAGLTAFLAHHR